MREIKFRAWDSYLKKMLTWDDIREECELESFFDLISFEKMQYTGLKDKNGVEIYEGDIVRAFSVVDMVYDYYYETDNDPVNLHEITFGDGCFQFKDAKQWSDGAHDWNSIENVVLRKVEVIGNIYENPELMKQQ